MQGLITEHHFEVAEHCFPGIRRFYLALAHKPRTFLELVWQYEAEVVRCRCEGSLPQAAGGSTRRPLEESGH